MKHLAVFSVLFSMLLFLLSGCASNDTLSADTTGQSAGSVPGEKVDGSGVQPSMGPAGAGANMHW